MKYNTLPGIKNTSNYEVISGGSGPVTPPDVPTEGDGTEAKPYSVGSIISMAPSSTTEAVESSIWVEGYLVGYYQNYNAIFTADGCTQGANILMAASPTASSKEECICIQLIKDTDPRKALNLIDNPGNLGKKISVRGDVMKYNTLPGIKNTNAYKIDGQTGGETPDEPSGDVVFEESFASSQGQFTIENIKMSDALTYVWTFAANYGMKASAYVNNANQESDSWLISPAIALPAGKSTLTFDHVVNKFMNGADPKAFCSVAIRENGGSWNVLNVPKWSTNADWTFVNSGAIDLSAYAGKSVQIGFHYISTTATSGTWEVKNFKITK